MKILLLYLFLLFPLYADEALSELFKQLETVSKEDKFKVVNSIKKHVIALKQQERIEAIKLLKAKKEAEAKLIVQENVSEMMSNAPTGEEHHDMSEMKTPQMASHMEQMQNMQNMGSMSQMPLMQEMRDRERGAVPLNMPNGMRGNR